MLITFSSILNKNFQGSTIVIQAKIVEASFSDTLEQYDAKVAGGNQ